MSPRVPIIAAVAAVDASPVFVGRDAELAILDRNLARAAAGRSSAVLVGGEAGVGKTRLVSEFASRVRDRGDERDHALILEGRCFPAHGHPLPYAPFADLFRELTRQVPPADADAILGPASHELGLIVLDADRPRAPGALAEDLETRAASRVRTFELVLGVAERLQRWRPVVILVEDLHWADQASLDLLGFLARTMRQARVLLLLTVTTDEARTDGRVAAAIGDLERTGLVERIELPRFSRAEVAAQIAGILHARPDGDLVDRVMARSDGNAFFAEELLAAELRGDAGPVPPLLDDLLRSRLSTVSETTRAVLRVAAVAGIEVDDDLVAAASGLPSATVAVALHEAAARGLLVRRDHPLEAYAFRHGLLQQAVERELLPGERRQLHAACARALVGSLHPERQAAAIARHWSLADRPERAFPAAVVAGLDAEARLAFSDARQYDEMALSLLAAIPAEAVPPGADELDLLAHAADVTALSGDPAAAVALVRRALVLLRTRDADRGRATFVDREWPASAATFAGTFLDHLRWYLWQAGDYDAAEQVLEEAYRLLPAEPPTIARARLLGHIAGLHLQRGRLGEALPYADEAVEASRATGGLPELALALGARGWCRAASGRPDDGIADVRESLAIADLLGRAEGPALAVSNLAMLLLYVGRPGEARDTAVRAIDEIRAAGLERAYGGTLLATAAAAAFALGEWDDARRLCTSALEVAPPRASAVWPVAVALRLAAATGDAELGSAAEGLAGGAVDVSADRIVLEWYRVARAETALASGDLAGAQALAEAAVAALPPSVLDEPAATALALAVRVAADRAETADAAGAAGECAAQRSRVAALLDDWQSRRRSFGDAVPDPAILQAFDALCAAEAARAAGRPAPPAWEQTALAHERLGRPAPAAYARYRHAEAILLAAPRGTPGATREARSAAATQLAIALRYARGLGAAPLLEAVASLARRGRLDVTPGDVVPQPAAARTTSEPSDRVAQFVERRHLTAREVEVLALVAAGWSNREIAGALYISGKTASVHVSNILGKLGVGDRVEAAVIAQRAGLVGPNPPGSEDADDV